MILTIVIAIYIISMLAALVFMIMWLRGAIKKQPNNKWKYMLTTMVIIFVSGASISTIRGQQYQAEQLRLEKIAIKKAKIQARDLKKLEVTSKFGFNDYLVLLMQPHKNTGVQAQLNGTAEDQAKVLSNAQKAIFRMRHHPAAKKDGVLIVSYVKVHKKSKPLFVLYASAKQVRKMSKVADDPKTFLDDDLTAYWFNKKFIKKTDDKLPGIFNNILLQDQTHMPKQVKKHIVSGKTIYFNYPTAKKKPTDTGKKVVTENA
ncbi:hypothetical protein [Periweissella ghanensis]|uniref:Uncharacterized protein n=1 Tax=Periweissella ghanensis TaxID=467997 RepID=A0ABN8BUQ4_9LACO|nr:hypothetical protein [Periweissella ghanensis]MCM0601449.1 hypothetical protein [Periweissella ghanensis]CAH0419501.1 hypothetical protein WGH24286_01960 [Periweissella ghanensis]